MLLYSQILQHLCYKHFFKVSKAFRVGSETLRFNTRKNCWAEMTLGSLGPPQLPVYLNVRLVPCPSQYASKSTRHLFLGLSRRCWPFSRNIVKAWRLKTVSGYTGRWPSPFHKKGFRIVRPASLDQIDFKPAAKPFQRLIRANRYQLILNVWASAATLPHDRNEWNGFSIQS